MIVLDAEMARVLSVECGVVCLFHWHPGRGGVLPYVTLMGTCGPIGYGFQGVLS